MKTQTKKILNMWSDGVGLNLSTLAERAQQEMHQNGCCDDSLISTGQINSKSIPNLIPNIRKGLAVIHKKL